MANANRNLGLGHGSAFGERGVAKRLGTLGRHTSLTGRRLLEIGCGDGTYTMRLVDAFAQIEAVDIQQDRLELFRERLAGDPAAARKINVRELSATELDYPDGASTWSPPSRWWSTSTTWMPPCGRSIACSCPAAASR